MSTQSFGSFEPLVSAKAPSPIKTITMQLANTATTVFSRRPQLRGSDSRLERFSMIIVAPSLVLGRYAGSPGSGAKDSAAELMQ